MKFNCFYMYSTKIFFVNIFEDVLGNFFGNFLNNLIVNCFSNCNNPEGIPSTISHFSISLGIFFGNASSGNASDNSQILNRNCRRSLVRNPKKNSQGCYFQKNSRRNLKMDLSIFKVILVGIITKQNEEIFEKLSEEFPMNKLL